MRKFLLLTILFTLLSCQKKPQDSKNKTEQKIIIEDTRIATKLDRLDSITFNPITTRKLLPKEINTTFTKRVKKNLDIEYPIYQAYSFQDSLGLRYLILTDHYELINNNSDTLYHSIKAFNLYSKDKEFKKRSTLKDDIDKDWETSINFWNTYSELADFDNDGYTDLILVYGTTGPDMYADGRVKIMIYHHRSRATIRHQNSEYGGRLTKISSRFYMLPKEVQKAAIEKMKLMSQNKHALFANGWENKMKKKATRIE